MTLTESLFSYLKADVNISSMVLDGSVYHIYPLRLPEGFINNAHAGSAISYTEINHQHPYPLLKKSTFQLNVFGDTFDNATKLCEYVYQCLDDKADINLGTGFPVAYVKVEGRQSFFDEVSKLWYYSIDISIKY